MVFLELAELLIVGLVFIFFLFQVIIPLWDGTLLFPSFRSKARRLESQLRQARSELELSEQEQKLQELKGRKSDGNESKTSL